MATTQIGSGRFPGQPQFNMLPIKKIKGAAMALMLMAAALLGAAGAGAEVGQKQAVRKMAGIPLSFEPNQGQVDSRVKFVSRGQGYSLFLTGNEAVLTLERQTGNAGATTAKELSPRARKVDTLRMALVGANGEAAVAGVDKLAGVVNYFRGSDPQQWRTNIPTYAKVNYAGIYRGIDLVFYGNQRELEYDFVVAPGADAGQIGWQVDGAKLTVDAEGNLSLNAPGGPAGFKKPVVYQMDDARKVSVDGSYRVAGNRVSFALGSYDHSKPLIIDPVLSYATYLGGAYSAYSTTTPYGYTQIGSNTGFYPSGVANPTQGLAVDSDGDVYVTGYTNATDFPLETPYQSTAAGIEEDYRAAAAFVSKFNAEGTGLLYSTYLSGSTDAATYGTAIAVDASGNAYVTGYTEDGTFPVTAGAYQTICGANYNQTAEGDVRINGCAEEADTDGFITKLDPTGSQLLYSTFFGATNDYIYSIAIDAKGQAYFGGYSEDVCDTVHQPSYYCFPTTSGAVIAGQAVGNLGYAFVGVLNAAGSALEYATLIGDSNTAPTNPNFGGTTGAAVAVDTAGDFFLTGTTRAGDLATTSIAYIKGPQSWLPGGCCAGFVAKFAPLSSGSKLDYLTYLTGPNHNGLYPSSIVADSNGEAYVAALNLDQDFPTTSGAYQKSCGVTGSTQCYTLSLTKFTTSGSGLAWSTMLGDALNGQGVRVQGVGPMALDSKGDVFLSGTSSAVPVDFPQVNPIQTNSGGASQPFITEMNSTGSTVLFSTFVGGGGCCQSQEAAGLAVDKSGNMYLAGNTNGSGLAVTAGAFQQSFVGQGDGYLVKIGPLTPSTTVLSAKPASITAGESETLTAVVTGVSGEPVPTGTVVFWHAGTDLGSGTLDGTGKATFTSTTLPSGTLTLTAVYSGDSFYSTSTSAAIKLTVNKALTGTTTALKISLNPSYATESITLTAAVTQASGNTIPTGTITFYAGSTSLGTVTLSSVAQAHVTTSALAAGTYSMTAVYNPASSSPYAASTSPAVSDTIKPLIATTAAVALSPASVYAGNAATIGVTVTVAAGVTMPTGSIHCYAGTVKVAAVTLNSSGTASCSSGVLAAGTYAITAVFTPTAGTYYATSTSPAKTLTVLAPIATTTTFTMTPNPGTADKAVSFSATATANTGSVTPKGTAHLYINGTLVSSITLSSTGTALFTDAKLASGSYSVYVSYGGSTASGFAASNSATQTLTVK